MIKVENITFCYDGEEEPALRAIDLQVDAGEYVAIVGPNGCGKTTLIKHLNGLLSPGQGNVWVDGLNTGDHDALPAIRQRVGMVFQNPDNQIVGMSVEEDVSFGPGNLELPPRDIQEKVASALALVGMENYRKRLPHTLSGGEKRLVAIAGVLAMNPSYVVLDEPTSFLDPSGQKSVLGVVKKLNEMGITIIHVTHDMDEIVHADRIVVMKDGEILLQENPSAVFARFEWLETLGLGTPKATELMWLLRQMGAEVRLDILTLDEACLELAGLIKS